MQFQTGTRPLFVRKIDVPDGSFRHGKIFVVQFYQDLKYFLPDFPQLPAFVELREFRVKILRFPAALIIQEKIVESVFANAFFKRAIQNIYAVVQPHVEGEAAQDVVEKAVICRDLQLGQIV